jgi:outer membrane lipoprotein-sorting protein
MSIGLLHPVGWDAVRSSSSRVALRATRSTVLVLIFWVLAPLAQAFDLTQLNALLRQKPVVRGTFTQEKHLRALPQPLVSHGRFVLAQDLGLLWLLQRPLQQDYRITTQGIARRDERGWQPTTQQGASERQNRLTLALLSGDSATLARDFELALAGDADHWQLTLTPRAMLLKQIFQRIELQGGASVSQIEILEAQGDRTLMRLSDSQADQHLTDTERHAFSD